MPIPRKSRTGIHTLYISPLKALTVDVARNLETPIAEMGLPIEAETRTGDTPQNRRQRQRKHPPHILLTTPESLALLLSYSEAPDYFASLKTVIIDELHAIADTKRGQLLALGLARLARLAPHMPVPRPQRHRRVAGAGGAAPAIWRAAARHHPRARRRAAGDEHPHPGGARAVERAHGAAFGAGAL